MNLLKVSMGGLLYCLYLLYKLTLVCKKPVITNFLLFSARKNCLSLVL